MNKLFFSPQIHKRFIEIIWEKCVYQMLLRRVIETADWEKDIVRDINVTSYTENPRTQIKCVLVSFLWT